MHLAGMCRQLLDLKHHVIEKICKRLCSRQMAPTPKTRIPRMIPSRDILRVCSAKMVLALRSPWLQSFVEEIDCLFMRCDAILETSWDISEFEKLKQVSLPKDGWGCPHDRKNVMIRIKSYREVTVWCSEPRINVSPPVMFFSHPTGRIEKVFKRAYLKSGQDFLLLEHEPSRAVAHRAKRKAEVAFQMLFTPQKMFKNGNLTWEWIFEACDAP